MTQESAPYEGDLRQFRECLWDGSWSEPRACGVCKNMFVLCQIVCHRSVHCTYPGRLHMASLTDLGRFCHHSRKKRIPTCCRPLGEDSGIPACCMTHFWMPDEISSPKQFPATETVRKHYRAIDF